MPCLYPIIYTFHPTKEAKEKSGTLITVDFALEQGRDVFVVPGNINSINSVGTNDLIRQGAKIVTSYEDVE